MNGKILSEYEARHPKSKSLAGRAEGLFPSGVTHDARAFFPFRIYVDHAQGARKWDVDGNMYIDYIGGHGSLLLGHRHPEVMEAASSAAGKGTHFGSSPLYELEWAEQVIDLVPCAQKVRFTSSGTEATMMALRLARAYTGRDRVIKFADHFHGWHDIVVGRQSNQEATPASIGVPDSFYDSLTVLPPNDTTLLADALSSRDVAAVIIEPTGAHWGMHPVATNFLRQIRDLTEKTGTLFIMDEVITGFRASKGGAQERYSITPDLSTHAKILAGGFPGGCVAGPNSILNILELRESDQHWNKEERVAHQGTYNGNPVSAAAGTETLRLISNGNHTDQAEKSASLLVNSLEALFQAKSVDASAWNVSSMWHLNMGAGGVRPDDAEADPPYEPAGIRPDLMHPLRLSLYNHGVDLMADGGMVSSAHGQEEIGLTVDAFSSAIDELRDEGLLE